MRIAVREQCDENNAEVNDTAGRLFWRQNGISAYDNTNKTFIITSINSSYQNTVIETRSGRLAS